MPSSARGGAVQELLSQGRSTAFGAGGSSGEGAQPVCPGLTQPFPRAPAMPGTRSSTGLCLGSLVPWQRG